MSDYRHPRRHRQGGSAGGPAAADGAAGRGGSRRPRSSRPADPRRTAYDVLAAVRDRAAYANLLLPRLLAERGLAGRDAALTTELAYGTLRGQGSYDAVLAACSDRPLDKLDPPVLDVLRLGTHQLLSTRVGAHAAVATSVDLAKSVAGPRVSGYVNAVLRRVATRDLDAWLDIVAPGPAADPDGDLAVRYSHPRWVVAAYRDALGPAAGAELDEALAAGNARPRVTLSAFPAGPPRGEIMPADAEAGRWSPYAFTLPGGDPAPLIRSGAAAVQDEGSQLAAIALSRAPVIPGPATRQHAGSQQASLRHDTPRPAAPRPAAPRHGGDDTAERWLDMCAGPGGKARLLYGLAVEHGARLTAAELHPHRAALVREALSRASLLAPSAVPAPQSRASRLPGTPEPPAGADDAGLPATPGPPVREDESRAAGTPGPPGERDPGFEVLVADSTRPPWPDDAFDRVLVDVPCSGLGALRRRPEARWRKSEADLPALAALQCALLRSALAAVRPGGVVGYVTCSPVPAETSDVIADVAKSAPGIEFLDTPRILADVPGVAAAADPRFAQLWPHRHGTDAIFIALLRRSA